jgi:hypothetical protein
MSENRFKTASILGTSRKLSAPDLLRALETKHTPASSESANRTLYGPMPLSRALLSRQRASSRLATASMTIYAHAGQCRLPRMPLELWQRAFRFSEFFDFVSFFMGAMENPCHACWVQLRALYRNLSSARLTATERFVLNLVCRVHPKMRALDGSANRRSHRVKRKCPSNIGDEPVPFGPDCSAIAVDVAIVNAERLGVPRRLIESALGDIAWRLNFVHFGQMVSRVSNLDMRANILRCVFARQRVGPRSAAANALAALETGAADRNLEFLWRVVRDWDTARRAEFIAVVHAALSDPQRLCSLFCSRIDGVPGLIW